MKTVSLFLQTLKNNGSLYAHIFFARSGYTPDPNDPEYQPLAAFGKTHRTNVFLGIFIYFFLYYSFSVSN